MAAVVLIGGLAAWLFWPASSIAPTTPTVSITPPASQPALIEPVADFKARITKKPFGLYVEPNNSPVQPERFTGYHTGVDIEYDDVDDPVPIYVIADGQIIHAGTASGYGGVVAIHHKLDDQPVVAIYGHLDPAALPPAGTSVTAGETIGQLGEGFTPATDGERQHLHFGLYKGSMLNLRGYVANQTELSAWLDPLTIFK